MFLHSTSIVKNEDGVMVAYGCHILFLKNCDFFILTVFLSNEKHTKYVSRLRFIETAIQFINSVVHTYTLWT